MNFSKKGSWGIIAFVLVLFLFPIIFRSPYLSSVMIIVGLYGIIAMGLGLLLGFTGQISIAQAAFYGIGAYTSAIMTATYGISPWIAIPVGCVISALVALVIGLPTLKLEENYLALATLGFGIIVHIFFMQVKGLTGGPSGLTDIPKLSLGFIRFDTDIEYYYLVWTVALGLLLFSATLVRSRVGRALRAIRGSEIAAESLGIGATKFKVKVFMLSAVYASIAGSLYAHYISFISPSPFSVHASINFVIIAVVGGLTNIWGGLIGAALIIFLGEFVREVIPLLIPEAGAEYELILYGIILVATMIFLPQGLAVGIRDRWLNRFKRNDEKIGEGEIENESTVVKNL